jgi:hypothetical protein
LGKGRDRSSERGGIVKAKVDVSRIGYANRDIEVEIPDEDLVGLSV